MRRSCSFPIPAGASRNIIAMQTDQHVYSVGPHVVALIAMGLGLVSALIVTRAVKTFGVRIAPRVFELLHRRMRLPWLVTLPIVALVVVDPAGLWAGAWSRAAEKAEQLALTLAAAWLVVRFISVGESLLIERLTLNGADVSSIRKARTQISFLRKLLTVFIAVVTVALTLMSFAAIRRLGTSLLASAGVAGLIFGIAAQRSIGNLVAGFQILLTQTIRLDDAVVVEGEWGTIEEITLTYVVVRVWDLRRLILPITYFVEKPFQNWTRSSANILGTVTLWVDFATVIEDLRGQFRRIVEGSPLWDRVTASLQVTEASETAIQVRCLVSAKDAATSWELRCEVREKLLAVLRSGTTPIWPRRRLSQDSSTSSKGTAAD